MDDLLSELYFFMDETYGYPLSKRAEYQAVEQVFYRQMDALEATMGKDLYAQVSTVCFHMIDGACQNAFLMGLRMGLKLQAL